MYKSIIEFHDQISTEEAKWLTEIANKAFDNRAGKVENQSKSFHCLSYEGNETDYGCLEVGMLILKKQENFLSYIKAWNWIDEEEPDENTDILALVRKHKKYA